MLDSDWILRVYLLFIWLRNQVQNRKLSILFLRYGLRYITRQWVQMGQRQVHIKGREGSWLSSRSVGYWNGELLLDKF
jgi:hypothetical protein